MVMCVCVCMDANILIKMNKFYMVSIFIL